MDAIGNLLTFSIGISREGDIYDFEKESSQNAPGISGR